MDGKSDEAGSSKETLRRLSSYEMKVEEDNKRYLAALETEKQQWTELAAQRDKALRVAKKEAERPMTLTYDDVKAHLTPEEREFLAGRPDYAGLLKSARDMKNAIDIAAEEKRETSLRAYHVVEKLQAQLNEDTKALIDLPDPILD